MTDGTAESAGLDAAQRFEVVLLSPILRVTAATAEVLSHAGPLAILAMLLLADRPLNPLRLMRLTAALWLAPVVVVSALRLLNRAEIEVDEDSLRIEQRHRRVTIPLSSIAAVEPWRLPLPGSGIDLELDSGARWADRIETEDPRALIDAVLNRGAPPQLATALTSAPVSHAHARALFRPRSWRRGMLELAVFALVPTIPLFRVHQIIAYGGAFGEYYQYGLEAYLLGFALYWGTLSIYLLLYREVLRAAAELIAAIGAAVSRDNALQARRIAERAFTVLYYAGVPIAVGLRFLPW
jgi:apolipoprotein N-acyltransferase